MGVSSPHTLSSRKEGYLYITLLSHYNGVISINRNMD